MFDSTPQAEAQDLSEAWHAGSLNWGDVADWARDNDKIFGPDKTATISSSAIYQRTADLVMSVYRRYHLMKNGGPINVRDVAQHLDVVAMHLADGNMLAALDNTKSTEELHALSLAAAYLYNRAPRDAHNVKDPNTPEAMK